MSSVQLLDKTRKIGKLLHNNNSSKVVFNDICHVLCEILSSNVLVISKKGKVLGIGAAADVDSINELIAERVGGFIDAMLNERMLAVLSTKENVNLETLGFENIDVNKFQAIITPIEIAGERLGTLFIYKCDHQYDIDDIILNSIGGLVGVLIYRLMLLMCKDDLKVRRIIAIFAPITGIVSFVILFLYNSSILEMPFVESK